MQSTELHQEIMGALFDLEKLCVTKECVGRLRRYRQMFPNKSAREGSKRSVFFQKFFSDLHQDAMICYLEKSKGFPLNRVQEQYARLDVDTQLSLAIAADWNHVIEFYSHWFDRLEREFDRQYFDLQGNAGAQVSAPEAPEPSARTPGVP